MYGVVAVGEITPLEWAMVVAVRDQLLLDLRSPSRRACSASPGSLVRAPRASRAADALATKTAIVMPIYNEAPARVFAALQAIEEDVEATGLGDAFDYFFLSDTTDPDVWIAEERALLAMRERLPRGAPLLSPPAQEHRAQGRQYRRFRHALGRRPIRRWSSSTPTA